MSGYELSRSWFNYCLENPERVKPNHTALFFWIVENFNRFEWKPKIGLPTGYAMEVLGIRSYNTYISALNDLVDFGFVVMVERSKNQYSSNIIALSKFNKAHDKATTEHTPKQSESTIQSTGESNDSIIKPITIIKPINQEPVKTIGSLEDRKLKFADTLKPFLASYGKDLLNDFYAYWTEPNKSQTKFRQELQKTWDIKRRLETWANNDKNFKKPADGNTGKPGFTKNR